MAANNDTTPLAAASEQRDDDQAQVESGAATTASRVGPWVRDGKEWNLVVAYPGNRALTYSLEFRRAEPSCPAGWYLFGESFDGVRLVAVGAEMARFEAAARVFARCPAPSFDSVWSEG